MVELIIVMVVIGILAAIAGGRFFDRQGYDVDGFAEQARSMLRHAQKLAIAQNRNVQVRVEANRISLCFIQGAVACPIANRVLAPTGSNSGSRVTRAACVSATWFCEGRPDGITLAANSALPAEVSFDALGRPLAATGAFTGFTLSVGNGASTRTITVTPETGYVN